MVMKTAELASDFENGYVDEALWTVVDTADGFEYTSVFDYDMTFSSVVAQAEPDALTDDAFYWLQVVSSTDATSFVRIGIRGVNPGAFQTAVSRSGVIEHSAMDFNSETMIYWQMREEYGYLYFETSPDATNWTVRWSVVHGIDLALVKVVVTADLNEGTPGTGYGQGGYGDGTYGGA